MPRLDVEGAGPVALPLLPAQAEAIIAVAKRAPFGRGERTLVDTDVRRTWQIGPNRIRIDGEGWAGVLAEIVQRTATVPALSGIVERWTAGAGDRASPLWAEAHDLSAHMIATWPSGRWRPAQGALGIGSVLGALARLADAERIDGLLEKVAAAGLCAAVVAGDAPVAFADAAEFLAEAAAAAPADHRPAARALPRS